jgi:hypothetical protein
LAKRAGELEQAIVDTIEGQNVEIRRYEDLEAFLADAK